MMSVSIETQVPNAKWYFDDVLYEKDRFPLQMNKSNFVQLKELIHLFSVLLKKKQQKQYYYVNAADESFKTMENVNVHVIYTHLSC